MADLFFRDTAAEENAAIVLPVDLAHISGVSAFNHQHKTRRTVQAVILRRQHLDGNLGDRQFLKRLPD